jgi:hypothetical protein
VIGTVDRAPGSVIHAEKLEAKRKAESEADSHKKEKNKMKGRRRAARRERQRQQNVIDQKKVSLFVWWMDRWLTLRRGLG